MKVDNDYAQNNDPLQIHDEVSPEDLRWNNVLTVDFDFISNLGPTDEVKRLEADDQPTKIIDKVLDELRWVIKTGFLMFYLSLSGLLF